MAYHPPSWYSPPDKDGEIVVMQAPVIDSTAIDPSAGSTDSGLANAIINHYGDEIAQFISSQRRNYALGVVQMMDSSLSLPGLDVDYQVQQGRESVTLRPRPNQSGSQSDDRNMDGYIAWVHPGTTNPDPSSGNTVPLYINGYQVSVDMGQPIPGQTSVWLVLFGRRALRSYSLADDENPFKAGVVEPDQKNPVKLLNPIIPERKKVDDHADLPGYFIMNWNDPANHYAFKGKVGSDGYSIPDPVIVGGVQFYSVDKDQKNSPLRSVGLNTIMLGSAPSTFIPAQAPDNYWPPSPGSAGPGDFLVAEFYDRKSGRLVQQSWIFPFAGGNAIGVNDRPLWWLTGDLLDSAACFDEVAALKPMIIDLSLDQTTGVSPGQPSAPTLQSGSGDSYGARLAAYFAERVSLLNVFATADATYETAIQYYESIYPLSGPAYDPYVAALAAESALEVQINTATRSETANELTTSYAALLAAYTDFDTKAHAYYDALVADTSGYHDAHFFDWEAAWPAVQSAIYAYADYKVNHQPWPDSGVAGDPIDAFNYREFTVADGKWTFKDWTLDSSK